MCALKVNTPMFAPEAHLSDTVKSPFLLNQNCSHFFQLTIFKLLFENISFKLILFIQVYFSSALANVLLF